MEKLYDQIYQSVYNHLKSVEKINKEELTEVDAEKVERMEMALQASKDILENMLTPGKKLNFIYEKGSLHLEIFAEEKEDE
ncbi:hypothetical protein [Niallia sp. NCCP-28]|uniref:hypothetical protein n=1 Tax=Niallia sp. NCCP-28 TaxID=2934712 RepID=UPI00208148E6|nr:hypothetical protein [Niallia sp. NCCP-28]GKU81853.1 hypothetical protein NCCP28_12490 [Niallia sp. NCCP-28]